MLHQMLLSLAAILCTKSVAKRVVAGMFERTCCLKSVSFCFLPELPVASRASSREGSHTSTSWEGCAQGHWGICALWQVICGHAFCKGGLTSHSVHLHLNLDVEFETLKCEFLFYKNVQATRGPPQWRWMLTTKDTRTCTWDAKPVLRTTDELKLRVCCCLKRKQFWVWASEICHLRMGCSLPCIFVLWFARFFKFLFKFSICYFRDIFILFSPPPHFNIPPHFPDIIALLCAICDNFNLI